MVKKNYLITKLFKNATSALLLTGLVLTSCSSEKEELENVLQSENISNRTTPVVGGVYTLINVSRGRTLEIAEGSNADGANAQVNGTDINTSITHRQWEIISVGDEFVRLRNIDSRRTLEIENGSNLNGANAQQIAYANQTHQEWEILSIGDEIFRLRNRDSRKTLRALSSFNVDQVSYDGSEDQQWIFTEVDSGETTSPTTNPGDEDFGLDPSLEPWENFDLSDWSIDTPVARPSDECRALRIDEDEWDIYRDSDAAPYFFTHTDGGMRFISRADGVTTSDSCDEGFPRSELREQLREGNTSISTTGVTENNWALGYQPSNDGHGGRNGELTATLRINRVTTTGDGLHPGRTIIGQIHASDDEPARLYYRKLPGADFGCVYLEHEINGGDDVTFNLIGDERCNDNNGNGPTDGIQLDELFSYEIINEGAEITVIVRRGDIDGDIIAQTTVDMEEENSGYDERDEWMYFKAGLYTQNNTGDAGDTDVATFYRLSNSHDNN